MLCAGGSSEYKEIMNPDPEINSGKIYVLDCYHSVAFLNALRSLLNRLTY